MAIWQNGRYGAAQQYASPNCEARLMGEPVDLIVLHNISLPPLNMVRTPLPFVTVKFKRISTRSLPSWLIYACPAILWFCARGRCNSSCRAMIWRIAGISQFHGPGKMQSFSIGIELEAVISSRLPKHNMPHCCPCCTIFARFIRLLPLPDIKTFAPQRKTDPGHF